ncbi:MAG: helix-hairpin-helix domain-containing protein [Burkholderiaceae bacterium]
MTHYPSSSRRAPIFRRAVTVLLAVLLCTGLLPASAREIPGIDANTATEVELDAITGIGPALAGRIIEERRKAPFASLDDLRQRVRGVGPASLRRMQADGLVVGPPGAHAGRSRPGAGGADTIAGQARSLALPGQPVVSELPAGRRTNPR